ncbi:Intraflagellar transport protein 74 [Gonapodya sp. JEL0774]|nr:Intraflagellar transport protein 74 [Gonapodya sp. JEL0774]
MTIHERHKSTARRQDPPLLTDLSPNKASAESRRHIKVTEYSVLALSPFLNAIRHPRPHSGPGRLIQDASFYAAEVRSRAALVQQEITRMERECEDREREAVQMDVWEKNGFEREHVKILKNPAEVLQDWAFTPSRSSFLTTTLTALRAQLADLNLLSERAHAGSDPDDVEQEARDAKEKNDAREREAEAIMGKRKAKEQTLRDLEGQLDRERRRAEEMVTRLPPNLLVEYRALTADVATTAKRIAERQEEADRSAGKLKELEQKRLAELKAKRDEMASSGGGETGREGMVEEMKRANQEAAAMERRIGEVEEEIRHMKEKLDGMKEGAEGEVDRRSKFAELARRDRDMTSFLESYDRRIQEARDRIVELEREICEHLEKIAALSRKDLSALPTHDDFKELQGDLKFKEKEMKTSENTLEAIGAERDRLLSDLGKVNQLDTKIAAELVNIKEKAAQISAGMLQYETVEELRRKAETQKNKNAADRATLVKNRDSLQKEMMELEQQHQTKRRQLEQNETHIQLAGLEEKLKLVEKSNHDMREYIDSKTAESDYKEIRAQVLTLVTQVNDQLLQIMALPPAR